MIALSAGYNRRGRAPGNCVLLALFVHLTWRFVLNDHFGEDSHEIRTF